MVPGLVRAHRPQIAQPGKAVEVAEPGLAGIGGRGAQIKFVGVRSLFSVILVRPGPALRIFSASGSFVAHLLTPAYQKIIGSQLGR